MYAMHQERRVRFTYVELADPDGADGGERQDDEEEEAGLQDDADGLQDEAEIRDYMAKSGGKAKRTRNMRLFRRSHSKY